MNNIAKKQLVEYRAGFEIYFEALPENSNLEEQWSDSDADHKNVIIEKVHSGEMVLFCARVTAERYGVVLAMDHAGLCVYNNYKEFYAVKTRSHFNAMADTVVKEAKRSLEKLTTKIAS